MLTPTRWNPHDDAYAANVNSMLDWEGNILPKTARQRIVLSDIPDDLDISSAIAVVT